MRTWLTISVQIRSEDHQNDASLNQTFHSDREITLFLISDLLHTIAEAAGQRLTEYGILKP